MIWQDIIQTYNSRISTGHICPVAHTKIIANIGIMLDESSNILAAAKIKQSIFAPCTAKSECRSSNTAPHLIHDNVSYVTSVNTKRHDAYMEQLNAYVTVTKNDDVLAKCVLKYLDRDTICHDLECLIDLKTNQNLVITFGIKGYQENTVNYRWTKYHLSQLPPNGICAITGDSDYIPDAYPGNLRFPGDMAKLFCTKSDKLDGMPQPRAGYMASQKVIHTLQSFFSDWTEQGEIAIEDIVIGQKKRENYDCG